MVHKFLSRTHEHNFHCEQDALACSRGASSLQIPRKSQVWDPKPLKLRVRNKLYMLLLFTNKIYQTLNPDLPLCFSWGSDPDFLLPDQGYFSGGLDPVRVTLNHNPKLSLPLCKYFFFLEDRIRIFFNRIRGFFPEGWIRIRSLATLIWNSVGMLILFFKVFHDSDMGFLEGWILIRSISFSTRIRSLWTRFRNPGEAYMQILRQI